MPLTDEQIELAAEIRAEIPPDCFRCHKEEVRSHPDACVVSETLAVGGQLLVTSNMRSMGHDAINRWVKEHWLRFGFRTNSVLIRPDDWIRQALQAERAETRRKSMAQLMLRAFWPWNENGSNEDTAQEVLATLARIHNDPYSGTIGRAQEVLEYALDTGDIHEWIEEIRRDPPVKTLAAEQRHPLRRGHAWPGVSEETKSGPGAQDGRANLTTR